MKQVFIATVQICLGSKDEDDAVFDLSDKMTRLMQEHPVVMDWGCLKIGGQYLSPTRTLVPDEYNEGDAFK
jgi:hypothetical protein